VRVAPRRWGLRPLVEAELARFGRLDALVEAELGTARATTRGGEGSRPLPMTIRDELAVIGAGLRRLVTTEQLWPKAMLDVVRAIRGGSSHARAPNPPTAVPSSARYFAHPPSTSPAS
jgi:hypothetical protein